MMVPGPWWWPYVFILIAGWLATDIWRWAGVFAALRVDENGEVFRWVRAVSNALIAALISKLVLFPPGALADAPLILRGGCFLFGVAVFFAARRSMMAGILAAEAVLLIGLIAR